MKIINIKATKSYMFEIQLEDGRTMPIHEDTFVEFQIHKGMDLDEETFQILTEKNNVNECVNRGLYYLRYGRRSRKQMRDYLLRKEFPESITEEALDILEERDFLDDESLARDFLDSWKRTGKYGNKVLKQKLYQKGFSADVIQRLDFMDDGEAYDAVKIQASKKWPSIRGETNYERTGKLAQFLYRKGFDSEIIWKVVDEFKNDE